MEVKCENVINGEMIVPCEDLDKAIVMQEEFIRKFYEKYKMTPEFDVLILAIMNELKYRKKIEKGQVKRNE